MPTTTTTPSRSQAQRKALQETAHMSVLGMDGMDLQTSLSAESSSSSKVEEDGVCRKSPRRKRLASSPKPSSDDAPLSPDAIANVEDSSKKWWGKIVWGMKTEEEEEHESPSPYQSMESPLEDGLFSHPNGLPSLTTSASLTPTVEDQLKQACSFFYQGMEDTSPRQTNPRDFAKSLSIPRVLGNTREGAIFYAKYERLNQDVVFADSDDLFLDEGGMGDSIEFRTRTSIDPQNSTLCYEQDGRLLMRLPRDQVRLIMDQDLEPGIIAVEQCRKNNDPLQNPVDPVTPPPLRYVMTVPDDLYRRVVAEMSYEFFPPCWGFFRFSQKADIKLALSILFVVLLLMFISTMVWPTV